MPDHQDLLDHWQAKGGPVLGAAAASIARVKGPFGAFLHHLAQIGWTAVSPWQVTTRDGTPLDLREDSPQWVADLAKRDAQEVALEGTMGTRLHDGDGLDRGADLGTARRAIRNIARKDPHLGDLAEAAVKWGPVGGGPPQAKHPGHGGVPLLPCTGGHV